MDPAKERMSPASTVKNYRSEYHGLAEADARNSQKPSIRLIVHIGMKTLTLLATYWS